MSAVQHKAHARVAAAVNLAFVFSALALLVLILLTGQDWLDRHFLPSWQTRYPEQLRNFNIAQVLAGGVGLFLLILVRGAVLNAIRHGRPRHILGTVFSCSLAVAASLVTTEMILRSKTWHALYGDPTTTEPMRLRDRELGWVYIPHRLGRASFGERRIEYAINRDGYRTRSIDDVTDFRRPAIVLAGESILLGWGLHWHESVGAQLERLTGTPVVNVSVNAMATDQLHMRIRRELPRFAQPVALVTLFMPRLVDRNLNTDRPWLDAQLRWHPGGPQPYRLIELTRRLLPYRSDAEVAEGIARTQAALRGTLALAEARGAKAYIVVPQFEPADPIEHAVRKRVLDDGGIPYVLVRFDRSWVIADRRHPDARASALIARALAERMSATAEARKADVQGRY